MVVDYLEFHILYVTAGYFKSISEVELLKNASDKIIIFLILYF